MKERLAENGLEMDSLEKKEATANRAAVTESQFNDFTFFTAVLSYGTFSIA